MNPDEFERRRKRAQFRSWHRGMREMDLLLGPFADCEAAALTPAELEQYEAFLDLQDADLLGWITSDRPGAPDWALPLIRRIRDQAATRHPS